MINLFKFVLLVSISTLYACDQANMSREQVAVIDLNEIAKVTGQDDIIRSKVDGVSADLTEQLRSLLSNMETQLQAEREKLGANPAQADMQRIQAMAMQAQQQIGQAQTQANNQVAAIESELVQELRDKLLPLARKEASSRGASILIVKDAYLFWSEDSVEITGAVVSAWDLLPEDQKVLGAEESAAESAPATESQPAAAESAPETEPAADEAASSAPDGEAQSADE